MYGTQSDDELVWQIVKSEKVKSVGHLRMVLIAFRLMQEEKAPWQDVSTIIDCADAEAACIKLVILLQHWEPMLAQVCPVAR